ncbi:MAG: CoA transferase, partial [Castellaniella sp.]
MTTASVRLPLEGVRVLDLSRVLAGPMSVMTLGGLVAGIIKVEHPGRGDDTRDWGVRVGDTATAYFNSVTQALLDAAPKARRGARPLCVRSRRR